MTFKMARRLLVCGNWKLHYLAAQSQEIIQKIVSQIGQETKVDKAIAPVATVLWAAHKAISNSSLKLAAQNVYFESKGAFTGEWSVAHLVELGCTYAICGHSERRQFFGETDETVCRKVEACLNGGLTPIACVGESLAERQAGRVEEVVTRQVSAIVKGALSGPHATQLVIAYEPIWAIGTGQTASPEQAQEVHALIRLLLHQQMGDTTAEQVRIVYGGSVKPDNALGLFSKPDIDGGLVGGASLEADSFVALVRSAALAQEQKSL